MIVDLPSSNTSVVNKKLVELREKGGVLALGRVLTLVVVTDDGAAIESAIEAANTASREHPCRVIVSRPPWPIEGDHVVELATEVRWQDTRFRLPLERIRLSEELGYDAVFTAEGFGSDALVPLGIIAGQTSRLKLGTRIAQVTGRPPALAAMAFQTLNHATGGGRVMAGLGSASPLAAECFHSRAWGSPVGRMRDYVTVLRQAFAGQPLDHAGTEWSAPYRGSDAQNLPPAPIGLVPQGDIPVLVAAAGPAMTRLAAEIADGWLPPLFAPGLMKAFAPLLQAGFDRAGRSGEDFAIWAHVDVLVDDDVRAAMRPFKEYTVTWAAIQHDFMVARGYGDVADRLADLRSDQDPSESERRVQTGLPPLDDLRWREALAAVPDEYIDEGWLVGPLDRIAGRVQPWLDCGLTGLVVRYGPQTAAAPPAENLEAFRVIAEAAGRRPVAVAGR
ncbi:LLM class flavin-dependent oxidoreductase [Pseudonocardia pini]|uniref:LLM class flavin-dependent oxidoreductase n=1 Tax=Pseudonocardia pini TaxID=2758030 RepID=UPI001C68F293|nr:LLM class flavin-dependent oxidoreductase [Pseudonocardia pini]